MKNPAASSPVLFIWFDERIKADRPDRLDQPDEPLPRYEGGICEA
jgi:hypothetical protein